jgi:hypothetical protein
MADFRPDRDATPQRVIDPERSRRCAFVVGALQHQFVGCRSWNDMVLNTTWGDGHGASLEIEDDDGVRLRIHVDVRPAHAPKDNSSRPVEGWSLGWREVHLNWGAATDWRATRAKLSCLFPKITMIDNACDMQGNVEEITAIIQKAGMTVERGRDVPGVGEPVVQLRVS